MVLVGGVAAGAGLTAMAGIATAASNSPARVTALAAPTTVPPAPPGGMRGPGRRGGPGRGGLGGAPGLFGGPGAGGTITAIDGSTVTLRTMNGTETVDTSSSTKFRKERETITFADLRLGEIVRVQGKTASTGTSTSGSPGSGPRTPPGTGTVDATRVTVVEPTFVGRVLSDSAGVVTLAGPDGQLLTVHTTSATRYYRGRTRAGSSVVSDGTHIVAEGDRTSLTTLDAAVIIVAPSPPAPGSAPTPAQGSTPAPPHLPATSPSSSSSSS